MGSIVKTIGKAIKGIGKAIKKIAPILLVAAVAYIGYGYMTGGGGWTQATDWGKSLMANASGGMPLSEAAVGAQTFPVSGPGSVAGPGLESTFVPPVDPSSTALGTPFEFEGTEAYADPSVLQDAAPDMTSTGLLGTEGIDTSNMATDPESMISGMGDTAASVAEGGGLISGPRINNLFDAMKTEYDETGLVPNFSKYLHTQDQLATIQPTGDYQAMGPFDKVGDKLKDFWDGPDWVPDWMKKPIGDYFPDYTGPGASVEAINKQAANQALSGDFSDFPTGQMEGTYPGVDISANQYVSKDALASAADLGGMPESGGIKGAANTIMSWGGKAWGLFKSALEKDPGMVLWSASKIIETIATLLDKSEEQEAYAARHVMGFSPNSWDDLREKSGGSLPGGPKSDFWKSVDAGNQGRLTASSKVKTGTKPMGNTRMSAINNSPLGILGSSKQGQV